MTDKAKDGGRAFPLFVPKTPDNHAYFCAGMTLRDWFAGQALTGLIARHQAPMMVADSMASTAYKLADAMLAVREGKRD